ncbi:MAG TPA: hypothetical protein VF646_00010 [Cytophagales bacterium]|jgi:uncharacterized iron-regulated membrane protein
MRTSLQLRVRKLHRYLGLVLGLQFLLWTAGGLYFSWSDMDEIHGDHQRHPAPPLRLGGPLASPSAVLDGLQTQYPGLTVVSVQVVDVLGEPLYQVVYQPGPGRPRGVQLASARTGALRGPLSRAEAVALAKSRFHGPAEVAWVEYLTTAGAHHEYRENPLPAYAVRFKHPSRTTVYVAAQLGTVQKFRNDKWRVFDFLWMLHTMDYASRDNFGNVLLRAFSGFGLLTIASGFGLYLLSSRTLRRLRKKAGTPA